MPIRFAEEKDKEQINNLWRYCFDDIPEFVEWFFENRYDSSNTLVVYNHKNKIQSALQLLPYTIMLRQRSLETSYMVGVSTWPQYRGEGHAKQLINKAMEVMLNRKQFVSILLPFQYKFYRKYGWEICYDFLTYKGDGDWFGKGGAIEGNIKEITMPQDIELLTQSYKEYTHRLNGYIERNHEGWYRLLKDVKLDGGNGYLYSNPLNQATGYVLFIIDKGNMIIKELAYNHPNAREQLFKFIANHQGQVKQFVWKAPSDDLTYMDMVDSRGYLHKESFVMGRIVDVIGALKGLPVDIQFTLYISVYDSLLPWNNNTFVLTNSNGYLDIQSSDKKPNISLTINTLTQLLWGYVEPFRGAFQGKIEYSDIKALEILKSIFPPVTTYLTEEF